MQKQAEQEVISASSQLLSANYAQTHPQNENNMKIEASMSFRRRDEEVKVHGKPDC